MVLHQQEVVQIPDTRLFERPARLGCLVPVLLHQELMAMSTNHIVASATVLLNFAIPGESEDSEKKGMLQHMIQESLRSARWVVSHASGELPWNKRFQGHRHIS